MGRLIDADALEQKMAGPFVTTYKEARQAVKDAPTVDAVPVVRCGECKYFRTAKCTSREDGWYCADGKRKDE